MFFVFVGGVWGFLCVFFERATKSLPGSEYPLFEQNCPGEGCLTMIYTELQTPTTTFDYGKPVLPHAAGPLARRIWRAEIANPDEHMRAHKKTPTNKETNKFGSNVILLRTT